MLKVIVWRQDSGPELPCSSRWADSCSDSWSSSLCWGSWWLHREHVTVWTSVDSLHTVTVSAATIKMIGPITWSYHVTQPMSNIITKAFILYMTFYIYYMTILITWYFLYELWQYLVRTLNILNVYRLYSTLNYFIYYIVLLHMLYNIILHVILYYFACYIILFHMLYCVTYWFFWHIIFSNTFICRTTALKTIFIV